MKIKKSSMVGFCERLLLPPHYAQGFADSAACWSVDQVALSLWLRHCLRIVMEMVAISIKTPGGRQRESTSLLFPGKKATGIHLSTLPRATQNIRIHANDVNYVIMLFSGFGPSAYVVVASDLHPVHDHNVIVKFADDTYLIVPGSKRDTINKELEGIQHWASLNNLKLNPNKSKEMLFR